MEKLDFSAEQLQRIDEVQAAVHTMCCELCEDPNLEYGPYIAEIADAIADMLIARGLQVHYPIRVEDEFGNESINEYYV